MRIVIVPNDKGNPPGKLADAELHFTEGPLEGLKLIGFGIWERKSGSGRNVTFPARQYSINGERRSFALLRPAPDSYGQERIRDLILEAYRAQCDAPTCDECGNAIPMNANDQTQDDKHARSCSLHPAAEVSTCSRAAETVDLKF